MAAASIDHVHAQRLLHLETSLLIVLPSMVSYDPSLFFYRLKRGQRIQADNYHQTLAVRYPTSLRVPKPI